MSSTQQGSSGGGCSSQKSERNRRSWTLLEETTLIAALKELISNGWKSDNGFRAGYQNKLETALRTAVPNTDLKAQPHINSKLSSWKKSYYSLLNMMGQSGFGFNPSHMIDCDDNMWAHIVKVDPNARLMRHKAWPYFDDWKEIFGKDRATGEHAEDMAEAWNNIRNEEPHVPKEGTPGDTEFSFENDVNDLAYDQVSQSARDPENPSQNRGKKPKVNPDLHGICELLSDMNQSTNSRLEHIANRIGYEFDMGKARQDTFDQLAQIPGLSLENRFVVCELIAFKAERLDIWRGMEPESRAAYVDHLLKTKGA